MDVGSQKAGRWSWAVRGASGLAVASAVSAAAAADGPRAAALLPPRVGAAPPAAVVARGAIDDDPLATTPVVRKGSTPRPLTPPTATRAAPDHWLSGVDPNLITAAATTTAKGVTPAKLTLAPQPVSALPPAASPKLTAPPPLFKAGDPNPLSKGVEAFKGFATQDGTAALSPAGSPPADTRSPHDPHTGKAPNGAPVLAGPPAWRWYGYGSVTPGANAYAPSGQYPRASANWYSVTKATPGAFPVPVVNPYRGGSGTEPPSYAGNTPVPTRPTFTPMLTDNTLPPPPVLNPAPLPPPKLGLMPTAEPLAAAPLPLPTMPSMTAPAPVSVAPPAFTPIPLPPPPAVRAPEPVASRPAAPPILPPLSVMPATPAPVVPSLVPTAAPAVAPVSAPAVAPVSAPAAAEDDVRWKSNPTHRPSPPPGTWGQPGDRLRSTAEPRRPIARGQIGDEVQEPTDAVEAVVQAVCRGRATGIDVRHTGPLQVTVCFEARSQTDATALVRDLSARPELARYEVNFCVLVK
ncbi:hypothetical protein [Urbifossiella limnaea]|uniref:Uncharacterized protein n=1 Tax=Urbifossiella limnaea TaxID=2528023 RepID=A0A517XXE3_9BACT|nr:hypothetical protein [Urbifossiella limnaea]QDU22187.1 hypothetical protein ETAA1_41630 [Urbifossiella limnaea]